MSVVFATSPLRKVHDINVTTRNGRAFVVDIYEQNAGSYDSTVTVLDRISSIQGSWLYNVTPPTVSGNDNFKAAIELISGYLASVDSVDVISDIHNPCNCPFVNEQDQNKILSGIGINLKVRVN
jgi:hypothetical protein